MDTNGFRVHPQQAMPGWLGSSAASPQQYDLQLTLPSCLKNDSIAEITTNLGTHMN